MIQISAPDKIVQSLIGKQKCNSEKCKLSQFVITKQYKNQMLLYNTLTCELVVLSLLEWSEVEANEQLIEKWFLVEEKFDEFKFAKKIKRLRQMVYRTESKIIIKKTINRFWILTTTGCNARCFYCHENGIPYMTMTDNIADSVINYILKQNEKNIRIMWYGGEPLLGEHIIERITNALTNSGIGFTSGMISNGYLFDEEMAMRAKEIWNLTDIQITLDGTEYMYNKVKNYISQGLESPFVRVISNIRHLLNNDIQVKVRINFDLYNKEDVEKLVDYLIDEFVDYDNFSMYIAPLMESCLGTNYVRTNEERKEVYNYYRDVTERLMQANILTKTLLPGALNSEMRCIAVSNARVIFPDGQFAFCHDYSEDVFSGMIDGTEPTIEERMEYSKCVPDEKKCEKCMRYPQCIRLVKCFNNKCTDELIDEWKWTTQNEMIWKYEDKKTAPL